MQVVTFVVGAFVATDENPLTAAKAFTTLSFFNILRMPLMVIPMLIGMVAGGTVAANGSQTFSTLTTKKTMSIMQPHQALMKMLPAWKYKIVSLNGRDTQSPEANGVDEKEGKVNLLMTQTMPHPLSCIYQILRSKVSSLTVVAGKVEVENHRYYRLTWRNDTDHRSEIEKCCSSFRLYVHIVLKSHGSRMRLYAKTLCLAPHLTNHCIRSDRSVLTKADIDALPGGDQTEIGERGINLSGGQKARVSLARACYANRDIVVLDDILSAVDTHIARTITDKCLVQMLRNKGRTVLIATHQTLCFPNADAIVILKDGQIAYNGSFADGKTNADFNAILGDNDSMDIADVPENASGDETQMPKKLRVRHRIG